MMRRKAILRLAGLSLAITTAATVAGRFIARSVNMTGADVPLDEVRPSTNALHIMQATPSAQARSGIMPAPGTRPEITPNKLFYRIDINTTPPAIDAKSWKLHIKGLFNNTGDLSYGDILHFPQKTQLVTMCCISNPIGGSLISTAFFTGVSLPDLLMKIGIHKNARSLHVRAIDGFYETISMENMYNPQTMLVFGMNGQTISAGHGFPVRFYIPNRYGMKQPKWVTHIEATSDTGSGFWVDRGWSKEARPHIVSIIDTVAIRASKNNQIPVGGIAWAGSRGIRKVEIKVDDNQWSEAQMLTPALGPLTWVLWRYDWPRQEGKHTFRVRATDGTGDLQESRRQSAHPNGATGYHEVTIMV